MGPLIPAGVTSLTTGCHCVVCIWWDPTKTTGSHGMRAKKELKGGVGAIFSVMLLCNAKSHCSKSLLVLIEAPVSSDKLPKVTSHASQSVKSPPAAGFLVHSAWPPCPSTCSVSPASILKFSQHLYCWLAYAHLEEQIPDESSRFLLTSFNLPQ